MGRRRDWDQPKISGFTDIHVVQLLSLLLLLFFAVRSNAFPPIQPCFCHSTLRPGQTHATFQRNILQYCWIVLWDVVKELAKRAWTSCDIQKCCNNNLSIFKLDPTPTNSLQHVATGCQTRVKHVARNIVARCCVEMLRAFGLAFTFY